MPIPLAPKVLSNALSSNSPTTRGRMASCSNQWSRRARTAVCAVGSSTGTVDRLCGKPSPAALTRSAVPYQATADVPMRWLYSLILGFAGAGRSDNTTSSRCRAKSPSSSSNSPSWHNRRKYGSGITGCNRRRTATLGSPSEMPTARRTVGALTASRTSDGKFSPS